MPDTKQPAKRGRPPKPADELRSERFELRLSEAEKAKLARLGGSRWVLGQLAKARE